MLGGSLARTVIGVILGGALVWSLTLVMAQEGPDAAAEPRAVVPSVFTYQGRLDDSDGPANGLYDFRFGLFDAASAGTQIGTMDVSLTVENGLFSAGLDFGSGAFTGAARWLEVSVRSGAGQDPYEVIGDRQQLAAVPYALHANYADNIFNRTVLVRPVGTAQQNGAALNAAIAGITTASATNRWLLKIEPGIYEIGPGFTGKDYVDIEGSGRQGTTIRVTAEPALKPGAHAEVRDLAVEAALPTLQTSIAGGIEISKPGIQLTRVRVSASGGTFMNRGIFIATGTTTTLTDVDVTIATTGQALTQGITAQNAITTFRRVTVNVSGDTIGAVAFSLQSGGTTTLFDVVANAHGMDSPTSQSYTAAVSGSANVTIDGGRFVASGSSEITRGIESSGLLKMERATVSAIGNVYNQAIALFGTAHADAFIRESHLTARGAVTDIGLTWVSGTAGTTVDVFFTTFDADLPIAGSPITFYNCIANVATSNANPNGAVFPNTCPT